MPTLAAEFWGVSLDDVLGQIRAGSVRSKVDCGFLLIDVAPDSPTLATSPRASALASPLVLSPEEPAWDVASWTESASDPTFGIPLASSVLTDEEIALLAMPLPATPVPWDAVVAPLAPISPVEIADVACNQPVYPFGQESAAYAEPTEAELSWLREVEVTPVSTVPDPTPTLDRTAASDIGPCDPTPARALTLQDERALDEATAFLAGYRSATDRSTHPPVAMPTEDASVVEPLRDQARHTADVDMGNSATLAEQSGGPIPTPPDADRLATPTRDAGRAQRKRRPGRRLAAASRDASDVVDPVAKEPVRGPTPAYAPASNAGSFPTAITEEDEAGPDPNFGEPEDDKPLNWQQARLRAAASRRRPPPVRMAG